MLRALKHHVLEEVGKAGPSGLFVLRADPVPQVDRDDGRLVVFVKTTFSRWEGEFFDLKHGDLRFPRFGGRWLGRTQHRPPKAQDHNGQAETAPAASHRSHESRSLHECDNFRRGPLANCSVHGSAAPSAGRFCSSPTPCQPSRFHFACGGQIDRLVASSSASDSHCLRTDLSKPAKHRRRPLPR